MKTPPAFHTLFRRTFFSVPRDAFGDQKATLEL
jgi:hypothetical protein